MGFSIVEQPFQGHPSLMEPHMEAQRRQDPSLFFQAIDQAGAFGVSTLFGFRALWPRGWRAPMDW